MIQMYSQLGVHLRDDQVTDILISAHAGLWLDKGSGLIRDSLWEASEKEVRALAVDLIGRGGRHIDVAHPCVDVTLADGIRVHAVLAPVAARGTSIAIRIPRSRSLEWDTLVEQNYLSGAQREFLLQAVEARRTVLISGTTGAGKTALLGLLLSHVPESERIVVLEDVAELHIRHPHVVTLEAQQSNIEGAGAITIEDLVPHALRMRADRLVLGECRGPELAVILSALNTGHQGGGLTLHANSLHDIPARLSALGFLAGMSPAVTHALAAGAVDLLIHVERGVHGRHIAQLGTFEHSGDALRVTELKIN